MRAQKILALSIGISAMVFDSLAYVIYIGGLGFPDGHLTEYEHKLKIALKIFAFPFVIVNIYLMYLGVLSQQKNIQKNLIVTLCLFFLLALMFALTEFTLYQNFEHGQGG